MRFKNASKVRGRAKVVKAMAHPTGCCMWTSFAKQRAVRLRLTEMIGADISTVSKPFEPAEGGGIVQDDKRGNMVLLSD